MSIRKYEYKEFEDTLDITSSGSLVFQQPKFEFYYGKKTAYMDGPTSYPVRSFSYTTKTTSNNLSFLRTQGADVGYQYIRILDIKPDDSEANGRTDNIFRAPQDNPELNDEGFPDYSDAYNIEYPFVPFKNSDFKRGQLKESRVYDKDGRELRITKNNYSVRDESELTTGVRMAIYNGGGCPYAWEYSSFANYMIKYNQSQSNPGGNYRLCGDPSSHIVVYPIRDNMGWLQLDSTETEEYFYNGNTQTVVETTENYTYSDANQQIKTRSVNNSLNEKLEIEYEYPSDLSGQRPWMATLTAENRISEPVVVKIKNLTIGEPLSVQETVYVENSSTSNVALPKHVFMKKGATESDLNYSPTGEDIRATFDKYDTKGNLLQYTLANGIPVSIIWGYNGQYPIAKVEGVTYSEIESQAIILSGSNNLTESSFNTLRSMVNASNKYAMLTCYLYKPLVGITTIIQPNGQKETYEYDDFGRLKQVKDHDGYILQEIEYHYQNQ